VRSRLKLEVEEAHGRVEAKGCRAAAVEDVRAAAEKRAASSWSRAEQGRAPNVGDAHGEVRVTRGQTGSGARGRRASGGGTEMD
jgi:hypothetical protein